MSPLVRTTLPSVKPVHKKDPSKQDRDDRTGRLRNISWQLTNGHEVQILVHTKTRHFCGLVARNGRKYPGAQRSPAVFLVKVPNLYL